MSAVKLIVISVFILAAILLSSCSGLGESPIPTPYPTEQIPTIIVMTLAAQGIELPKEEVIPPTTKPSTTPGATQELNSSPTSTATLTLQPIENTGTPSATPTQVVPAPDILPPANIPASINQIISPGSGSKVISPFILRAALKPGENSIVRIELLGEDSRLLMREVRRYQSLETESISIGSEVEFGINSVAEIGRLQISIEDEHGRLRSVSSVELFLQSIGNQDLLQPEDQLQDIILDSPQTNRLIQGGTMRVAGLARARTNQPLMIEIVTSDGKIVGTRQVSVTSQVGSVYGTFAIDVPYTVDYTTRVRVKVWEPGDRIPGIVSLSSVEVLISP